jgi:hypothetical protein
LFGLPFVTPRRVAIALAVVGLGVVWGVQIAWLPDSNRADVLVHDLRQAEYVTALHVKAAPSSAVVGRVSKVEKKKGMKLAPSDVEDLPRDQSVVAVFAPTDRAWGRALVVGLCVDVWNGAQPVTGGSPLKIVSVLPVGPDKNVVHLLGPTAGDIPGKVLAAKELALSVVPCRSRPAIGDDAV